jgi:hypothetical protein
VARFDFIPFWDVADRWPFVAHFLQKALDKQTAWNQQGIQTEILKGSMHLWEVPGEAALVTQIQNFPLERICVIVLCGGSGLAEHKDFVMSKLTHYAKAHGCQALTIVGRPGWARVLGFDLGERVMRKKVC